MQDGVNHRNHSSAGMVSAGWDDAPTMGRCTHVLRTSPCRDGVCRMGWCQPQASTLCRRLQGVNPLQGWCQPQASTRGRGVEGSNPCPEDVPMQGCQTQDVVSSHCKKWWRRGHPLAVVLAHDPRPIPSRTASLVSYRMWYRLSYRSAPLVRSRPCLTEACSVWNGECEGTSRMCVRDPGLDQGIGRRV